MGVVDLAVRDLDTVLAFYRDGVGLEVLEQSESEVLLGAGVPVLRLSVTDAAAPSPSDAGLYHVAILYADEPSLARALLSVAETAPASYQGSADHAVSLAFYLGDPEGNGVELYVDRPATEWRWIDGRVQMGSAALDPNAFIQQHAGSDGAGTAVMGHVHLKVGDIEQARVFYSDALGFDVTAEVEGAVFYSAGGYHHHLATNVWQSTGAGARGTTAGLGSVTVVLPGTADVDAVAERLTGLGVAFEDLDGAVSVLDPWGNRVRLVAES